MTQADFLVTGFRKFRKVLRRRGMLGFLSHGLRKARQLSASATGNGIAYDCYNDPIEREFDACLELDTGPSFDPGWLGRISSRNWIHGKGYHPAPIHGVLESLRHLDVPYEDYVFIDIGSGKGRMLLLASLFPFKKVIGIEFDTKLHEIALQNIAAFNKRFSPGATLRKQVSNQEYSKRMVRLLNDLAINNSSIHCPPACQEALENVSKPIQKCAHVLSVCLDAVAFDFPHENLVLFFHDPFERPMFDAILKRIENFLEQTHRAVRIIYFDPACGDLFTSSRLFKQVRSVRSVKNEIVPYAVFSGSAI